LTEKFAAIVEYFNPPFFVMENVARAKNAAAFERAVSIFENAGYFVKKIVLDASYCGVPQARKRLITIGVKDDAVAQKILELLNFNKSGSPMTVRDWFGDSLNTETYYRHPRSYARRGVFSIDEPSPTIRGVNRPIPNGYPGHKGDAAPVSETRPLTTGERAAIQTFPEEFSFIGSKTDVEQMIGNAVPVRLAAYIASAILEAMSLQHAAGLSDAVSQ
jgi:DNA (cytosine-5)-methyltransferase 1